MLIVFFWFAVAVDASAAMTAAAMTITTPANASPLLIRASLKMVVDPRGDLGYQGVRGRSYDLGRRRVNRARSPRATPRPGGRRPCAPRRARAAAAPRPGRRRRRAGSAGGTDTPAA